MRWQRFKRSSVGLFVILSLLANTLPAHAESHNFVYGASDFGEPQKSEPAGRNASQKFIDKWILNGGALGSAIGSIIGCFVFQTFFPGPVGLILGTLVGGTIGSLIGTYIDDRKGEAINYTSFERPPVTKGGIWLKGVGPWEQFMYQVDAFALNGGSIAANISHIGLSLLAKSVPGVGAWLSPVAIFVADYLAAVIGDNIDGNVDLGNIGKKWDQKKKAKESEASGHNFVYGEDFKEVERPPTTIVKLPKYEPSLPRPGQSQLTAQHDDYRRDYKNVIEQMQSGDQRTQREAFLAYRNSYSKLR